MVANKDTVAREAKEPQASLGGSCSLLTPPFASLGGAGSAHLEGHRLGTEHPYPEPDWGKVLEKKD